MKNITKKLIASALAVFMLSATFAACAKQPADEGGTAGTGDTLKIGGVGPLTSDNSSYGVSVKNGAQLAIDQINAKGGVNGVKLELLFQDDEADGAKSKSAYEKLMDDGMQILMGAVTSGASVALNDLVKADGILQVTPSASQLEATDNPNSFRICFTDPMQGELMAEYIYSTMGHKNVAIIYNRDDSYSSGINDAFKAKYTALGGKISAETAFGKDDKDFSAQLTQIGGSDAQCIFMPIYNAKAAQIAIAAKDKSMTLPLYGCDGWDGILEKYLTTPDQAALVEGAAYLTPFTVSDPAENVQAFIKEYQAKFNVSPDQFAADAYDAIYVIAAAITEADVKNTTLTDADNAALIKAMTAITVEGVTGKMTFSPEGEPNKSAKVAQIKDGKYVVAQ